MKQKEFFKRLRSNIKKGDSFVIERFLQEKLNGGSIRDKFFALRLTIEVVYENMGEDNLIEIFSKLNKILSDYLASEKKKDFNQFDCSSLSEFIKELKNSDKDFIDENKDFEQSNIGKLFHDDTNGMKLTHPMSISFICKLKRAKEIFQYKNSTQDQKEQQNHEQIYEDLKGHIKTTLEKGKVPDDWKIGNPLTQCLFVVRTDEINKLIEEGIRSSDIMYYLGFPKEKFVKGDLPIMLTFNSGDLNKKLYKPTFFDSNLDPESFFLSAPKEETWGKTLRLPNLDEGLHEAMVKRTKIPSKFDPDLNLEKLKKIEKDRINPTDSQMENFVNRKKVDII